MEPLSGTGYVILGMLALGVRTGYDIKASVDSFPPFGDIQDVDRARVQIRLEDER